MTPIAAAPPPVPPPALGHAALAPATTLGHPAALGHTLGLAPAPGHPATLGRILGLAPALGAVTAATIPGPSGTDITSSSIVVNPPVDCANDVVCRLFLNWTGSDWFAHSAYYLVVKPLEIILIIVLAIIARRLACRTINRLVRTTAQTTVPVVLRTGRAGEQPPPEQALPERRRQRAEAIGSVLRSGATVTIFSVALLTIFDQLGVNLAPLLASAGIVGVAIGFGAQTLVKDLIAGLFMLLEDQYGVGDHVDLGEASGVIESVGLRITTLRDAQGMTWYIRNGAINRVGNRSQGWAVVSVDVPVSLADVEVATGVLRQAAAEMGDDPRWSADLVGAPEVLGVEQITADGAVLRAQAKTTSESQWRVGREMRRRFTTALVIAQIDQGPATEGHDPAPGTIRTARGSAVRRVAARGPGEPSVQDGGRPPGAGRS